MCLFQYFRKDEFIYAFDPEKKCKSGDIVLIQQLPQKMTRLITHKVMNIVYPLGDITDPLTGKKCVVGKYREDVEEVNKIYGELPSRFKYEDAPDRGWQESKKDFTDKDTYVKYHEFENDKQPYSV